MASASAEHPFWRCETCNIDYDDNVYECKTIGCATKQPYPDKPQLSPLEKAEKQQQELIVKLCQTCGTLCPACEKLCLTCGKDPGKLRYRKIVLIGRPGAGKSSLINSFAASLGNEYYQYAPSGVMPKGKPKTIYINRFPKCCMDRAGERAKEKYKDALLPTLIDVAGLNNEADEAMKKFLTLLLYGHIQNEDITIDVYVHCRTLSFKELNNKYRKQYDDMRADVVVFVAAVTDPLPTNLMECVADIAGSARGVPVFGVLTKKDEKEYPDSEDVLEIQENFKMMLGLDEKNFLFCSCFCTKLFPSDAPVTVERRLLERKISAPLMKFLTQMCDPRCTVTRPNEPMPTLITEVKAAVPAVQPAQDHEPVQADARIEEAAGQTQTPRLKDYRDSFIFALLCLLVLYTTPFVVPLRQQVQAACDASAINNRTDHYTTLCAPAKQFYSELGVNLQITVCIFVMLGVFLELRRLFPR